MQVRWDGHADPQTPVDPAREDELAERGAALVAAAARSPEAQAPLALRERIEGQRVRRAPARRRRRAALAAVAGGAAALALAIALLAAPGGTPGGPSLSEAAALGIRPAQAAAPAHDSANRRLLLASEGGIRFPAWDELKWPASGTRQDKLGGRDATTVFYRSAAGPVSYTIVDGPPLKGTGEDEVHTMRVGGRNAVVWERAGHTCIITAPAGVPAGKLARLTTWE
jgi:hypothetical protein